VKAPGSIGPHCRLYFCSRRLHRHFNASHGTWDARVFFCLRLENGHIKVSSQNMCSQRSCAHAIQPPTDKWRTVVAAESFRDVLCWAFGVPRLLTDTSTLLIRPAHRRISWWVSLCSTRHLNRIWVLSLSRYNFCRPWSLGRPTHSMTAFRGTKMA
jgi:hypothetical protein